MVFNPRPDMVYKSRIDGTTLPLGDFVYIYRCKGVMPEGEHLYPRTDLRVSFSDRTVIRIGKWGDGIWRIAVLQSGSARHQLWKYDPEGANKDTDVFHIDAEVTSVRRIPHKEVNPNTSDVHCNVLLNIDIEEAREMLMLDGHNPAEVDKMSDKQVIDKALSGLIRYGCDHSIRGIVL